MKRGTIWLIAFCGIAVGANAFINGRGSFNSTTRPTNPPVEAAGNFEIGLAALDAGEFAVAFDEFTLLSKGGNADAQAILGTMYKRGEGVEKDYAQAMKWYRLSALQGKVVSQGSLGAMLADGKGAGKDLKEAYKWYFVASLNSDSLSNGILDWIGGQLSDQERLEAERLARLCVSSSYAQCE